MCRLSIAKARGWVNLSISFSLLQFISLEWKWSFRRFSHHFLKWIKNFYFRGRFWYKKRKFCFTIWINQPTLCPLIQPKMVWFRQIFWYSLPLFKIEILFWMFLCVNTLFINISIVRKGKDGKNGILL